jgi:ABC-type transport system involved in cytochrome c biogenesis permease subunit
MAAPVIFFNASFGLSLAALAAYSAGYIFKKRLPASGAHWALGLAWLALTAGLGLLWARLGHPPLSNQYESLLALLWFLFPLAFYYRGAGKPESMPAAALTACLFFGAAALLDRTMRPLMPALRSNWLIIHVLSSMAAYAAFALAAAAAAWALFKGQAEASENFLLRLTKTGFAFLTLGIITGAVWADTAWGAWWSWDPKETWSLLTWLAYAAALHLRKKGFKGSKFGIILLVCFALVLFTYFGVNFLLSGMHSYG